MFDKFCARRICSMGSLAVMISISAAGASRADFKIPTRGGMGIRYEVTPQMDASERRIDIDMSFYISGKADSLTVQLPVWSPGDYHIQNHAKFVQNLQATASPGDALKEQPATVTHTDANSWTIALKPDSKSIHVRYSIPSTSPGIFSENVKLLTHFGFVNGPAAYLYVADHKDVPIFLDVKVPGGWSVTAPLPLKEANGVILPSTFVAKDYDTLADSPLVFGDKLGLKSQIFQQDGVDYRLVLFRNPDKLTAVPDLLKVI